FILSLFYLSSNTPIFCDTLFLQSQEVIIGKVTEQSLTKITVIQSNGLKITIAKEKVWKIIYKDLSEDEIQQILVPKKASSLFSFWKPNYLIKNVIVPGWGFHDLQRKSLGITYSCLFFLAASNNYVSYTSMSQSKRKYRSASGFLFDIDEISNNPAISLLLVDDFQTRRAYKRDVTRFNSSLLITLLIYTTQLFHSYQIYQKELFQSELEKKRNNNFSLEISSDPTFHVNNEDYEKYFSIVYRKNF
ncbi:MAG: hypothetical protein AAF518_25310, partial [Spirochaetota bacterium]